MTLCLQALASFPDSGGLELQCPRGGSQPFVTPVLGHPAPSSALHRLEVHIVHKHTYWQSTHIHF